MKFKHLQTPFHVKSIEASGRFTGYGSVFETVDSYQEKIAPGAFLESLNAHKSRNTSPALLWQHNSDEVVGIYDKIYEDERGLVVEGRLNLDVTRAREAHSLMAMTNESGARAIAGLSIGFVPKQWADDDEGIRTLLEVDLWEVSIVTFPANRDAMISEVRSALDAGELPAPKVVERVLRDAGFSRKSALAIMAEGYGGLKSLRDAEADGSDGETAAMLRQLTSILKGDSDV